MLSAEDNALLTQTGPGTPGGEMLRRYWHPVPLQKSLPLGGAPCMYAILGEDLALFRNQYGELGLLGIHCSHRAADLSYGRVEDGGAALPLPTAGCYDCPRQPAWSSPASRKAAPFKDKVKAPRLPVLPRPGGFYPGLHGPGRTAAAPCL